MSKRLKLRVTLLEDLHSGTGTGGGVIDAIQARDRDRRPVIRASHVKGVLRDAAEDLAKHGQAAPGDILTLFGEKFKGDKGNKPGAIDRQLVDAVPAVTHGDRDNKRGVLVMQSLYWSEGKDDDDQFLIWSSTARKKGSRVARDETLRSVEFIKSGSIFEGTLLLRDDNLKKPEEMEELLKKCVRHMDCLGGSRNRGAGMIQTEWIDISSATGSDPIPETSDASPTLRLILRNLDPLCLPVTGFPGNIIPSECYIRGQALLGALAAWAIANYDNQEQRSWLLSDSTKAISIGNAYPLPDPWDAEEKAIKPSTGWETMPMPLHIRTPKPGGSGNPAWPWWMTGGGVSLLGDKSELDDFDPCQQESPEKPKRPGDHEFLFRNSTGHPWRRYSPDMGVHLRNQKSESELFSMEEIAENSLFMADIRFSNSAAANRFIEIFGPVLMGDDWLTIGRGSRPVKAECCQWLPAKEQKGEALIATDCFTLTLENDLIARSTKQYQCKGVIERIPNLGFCETLDPALLCDLAGIERLSPEPDFDARCDTVEVRGYNAASKLPRAPALAIRRGSAISISGANANALYEALELKQTKYLGERGKEGFGRFRLDFSPLQSNNSLLHGDGKELRLNRKEVLLARSKTLADKIGKNGPSKSQWQWLRKQANAAKDLGEVEKIFDKLREHAKTKGGEIWNGDILESINDHKVRIINEVGNDETKDVKFFLDVLVRQVVAKKDKGEGKS